MTEQTQTAWRPKGPDQITAADGTVPDTDPDRPEVRDRMVRLSRPVSPDSKSRTEPSRQFGHRIAARRQR